MQNPLFAEPTAALVGAAAPDSTLIELATALPQNLRLGGSSWNYPGWAGMVWDREYRDATLSRYGLAAYAKYPLFRTVCIDRSFYQPLSIAQYAQYAAQVPEDFRFVVKAPSMVCDAQLRDDSGRGLRNNDSFLNSEVALRSFVEPALAGLGDKLGALVFQISPLPFAMLDRIAVQIERLHNLLRVIPDIKAIARDSVVAVEVRDPQWLTPQFTQTLRDNGATYCMGLHAKMPRIAEQLPILRALWPGPLVCRWNLNPLHGAYGYEDAQRQYEPFDRIQDPDVETRNALARVIAGTVGAGQNAFVTLSNQAEGCAPLSTIALAEIIRELRRRA
ncbi:MAG TPA: DUF72 domain-containing protein [Spongiibacteraceae bacterium]|nr:DUF72 domain-containing protein [Spongiibacteraceae bacterium]